MTKPQIPSQETSSHSGLHASTPPARYLNQRFHVFGICAVITAIALFILPMRLSAQSASSANGSIEGRVFNTITQKYQNNARITIVGTQFETYSDEYGNYRLDRLPEGEVTLIVTFTGMETKNVPVNVHEGVTTQDLDLIPVGSTKTTKADGDVVVLDKFDVRGGSRKVPNNEIATNEQRFAINIKSVVETNAFGDVAEGNVGEFLKFLPGVTVDYVAADVRTVSVRGIGSNFTSVSYDGAPMASAASGASTRSFEFEQVSINNVARMEVTKVPIPSMRADSLGGSVNMVPKNALERKVAEFNYSVYANFNSEDVNFGKSPGPEQKETYKILPGFTFDMTLPVNRNFGIVVTGLSSNQFNEQHRSLETWNFAQAGATETKPYMQTYTLQDGPKNTYRDSVAIRADWRIDSRQTLSAGYQYNYYRSGFGNRNLNYDVGTNAGITWTPDATISTTGTTAKVTQGSAIRDKYGASNMLNLKYRYKARDWEADAGLNYASSKSWYRDTANGHFSGVNTQLSGVRRVDYHGIHEPRPDSLQAFNTSNTEINPYQLINYNLTSVRTQPLDAKDTFATGQFNIKKTLNLPFYAAVKTGLDLRQEKRDIVRTQVDTNYVGTGGNTNAAPYLDTRYGAYPYYGSPNIQWPDAYLVYNAYVSNPSYFAQTATQSRDSARYEYRNSYKITEDITATYLQFDAKGFNNKLTLTTGFRYERTDDDGYGAYAPNAGTTAAQVRSTWVKRGQHTNKSYDGFYPSLSLNYNITDNFIARFAYARTVGRPDYDQILPLVKANDQSTTQESVAPYTIEFTNPDLSPNEANNYDISLEYYLKNGGVLSGGFFYKDISNYFAMRAVPLTPELMEALGLDPADIGIYTGGARTTVNVGSARITGGELNMRMPLSFIPAVGRYLEVFANGTKLKLSSDAGVDYPAGLIEESANWGIVATYKDVTLRLNWNYRGRQKQAKQTGAQYAGGTSDFYEYFRPRTTLDVNLEYRFIKQIKLFANARNITNVPQILERYNDVTPNYARFYRNESYGVQITVGVKGTF